MTKLPTAVTTTEGRIDGRSVLAKDRFFVGMSAILLALTLIGFSKTYYLRFFLGTAHLPPMVVRELPVYLHLHGIILTLWFVIALVQPLLIASRRVDAHRYLGIVGVVTAVALVIVSPIVLYHATTRVSNPLPQALMSILAFLDMFGLIEFSLLVTGAIVFRRNGETHKRLMLIASLTLIGPAISRLPWIVDVPALTPVVELALVGVVVIHDLVRLRCVHRATLMGSSLKIVGLVSALILGSSGVGQAFIASLR